MALLGGASTPLSRAGRARVPRIHARIVVRGPPPRGLTRLPRASNMTFLLSVSPRVFRPHLRAVVSAAPLVPFRAVAGGLPIVLGLFIAHRWGRQELAAFMLAHA